MVILSLSEAHKVQQDVDIRSNLLHRLQKVSPFQRADVDSTTLGKSQGKANLASLEATGSDGVQPYKTRGGICGILDHIVVPYETHRDTMFLAASRQGKSHLLFGHLHICRDGGLSKSSAGNDLFSKSRVTQVILTFVWVLYNAIYILSTWWQTVVNHYAPGGRLLLLVDYDSPGAQTTYWIMKLIVTSCEFAMVALAFLYSCFVAIKYTCFTKKSELEHYRIWRQLYTVCCSIIPTMTSWSVMFGLRSVKTFSSDLQLELAQTTRGISTWRAVASSTLSTLLFAAMGFIAFTTKLALVVVRLQMLMKEQSYTVFTLLYEIALVFAFANQALGIMQVSDVETKRLFLFIFGGDDARMQASELDRQEAYLACVMHFIGTQLYQDEKPRIRRWKRAVAMLSFANLDMQSLVLAEDKKERISIDRKLPV